MREYPASAGRLEPLADEKFVGELFLFLLVDGAKIGYICRVIRPGPKLWMSLGIQDSRRVTSVTLGTGRWLFTCARLDYRNGFLNNIVEYLLVE